jgi:hypothetical protein
MNELDLSALSGGPDPVLASAAAVKARGDQRKQRGRLLVAGAAALVLLAGAGTAVALAGGSKPDALQVSDPTPSSSPAAGVPDPAGYVLSADDAARASGGTWQAEQVVDDPLLPLVVCPTGDGYAGAGAHRVLRRGPDQVLTGVVVQTDATRWVEGIRQDVLDCPRRAAEEGTASDSFTLLSGESAEDWVLVRDDHRDCDDCSAVTRLWLVVGAGDLLSFTALPDAEQSRVATWLGVVRDRLGHPVSEPPTPTPTASPSPVETVTDAPLAASDLLQIDRIGPVVVGMTLAEAREAAQVKLRQEGDDLGGCVFYSPNSREPDVSFMVVDGVVSRIDVDSGTTTTTDGLGIGSTEADVKRAHPDAVVSKHVYTDGHYLRVLSDDGRHAFLFETDGQKVTAFRSGFPAAVDAPEGCA